MHALFIVWSIKEYVIFLLSLILYLAHFFYISLSIIPDGNCFLSCAVSFICEIDTWIGLFFASIAISCFSNHFIGGFINLFAHVIGKLLLGWLLCISLVNGFGI